LPEPGKAGQKKCIRALLETGLTKEFDFLKAGFQLAKFYNLGS
jgi:hypothetical protein